MLPDAPWRERGGLVTGPCSGSDYVKVRADFSCKVIHALLQQAQDPNNRLEVAPGPRGGLRLGVNGKFDPKLNIMVKR
ncbi:MAG: hypothetical protein ACOVS5_07465 [Oligoflexus sp.]